MKLVEHAAANVKNSLKFSLDIIRPEPSSAVREKVNRSLAINMIIFNTSMAHMVILVFFQLVFRCLR